MTTPIYDAPVGHSRAAHRVHGWCSHCPGRTAAEEVIAWRSEAADRHAAEDWIGDEGGPFDASTAWRKCPECGVAGALSVVTVTVQSTSSPKRAGGWAYCLNCEAVPQERGVAHAG
ncbi:hypothetical protein [Streptomyces sp. SID11385]|uniref:hypothetical protein n=1 Tax=Streptomyces sp. SID11385 TaxID=2706031 RepID=UPI0013C9B8F9|nr:hypothetical protein [Streptomyces sp. SID11385]NEA42766.1 hypothetical protein [Streptomyces sp. SID11385]